MLREKTVTNCSTVEGTSLVLDTNTGPTDSAIAFRDESYRILEDAQALFLPLQKLHAITGTRLQH